MIVDSLEESREALRTALERRGVNILSAGEPQQGLALAREHQPDLIVVDLECENGDRQVFTGGCHGGAVAPGTPLVLIGSARRPNDMPDAQFISKPYHYAPLIRKIEQLLSDLGSSPVGG